MLLNNKQVTRFLQMHLLHLVAQNKIGYALTNDFTRIFLLTFLDCTKEKQITLLQQIHLLNLYELDNRV